VHEQTPELLIGETRELSDDGAVRSEDL